MSNTKTLSSSRILLFASAITIILLLVLSISKILHMKETSTAIDENNLTLQNNEDRLQELKALKDNHSKLENEHKTLIDKIPESPDKHKLIDLLYQNSKKNKVQLLEVGFDAEDEEIEGNIIIEMPLKLSLVGKYTSIMKFLKELNHGERLIRIDEINILNTDDFNNSSNVMAEITATGFYDK